MRIGAVFFDLDDTLVLTHEATRLAHDAVKVVIARRVPSIDAAAVVDVFIRGFESKPFDPLDKVPVCEWRAGIWDQALQLQGVQDMKLAGELQDCFDRERLLAFQWASGVETLVRNLKDSGYKIGLITNGHKDVQRAKLKACKASDLFDLIIVGGEEPHQKPHKDIFLKACHLAGCQPEESVMVGDNLDTDIQGGNNAGFLATIWVNLHASVAPEGSSKPSYTISSIAELFPVLKQIESLQQ